MGGSDWPQIWEIILRRGVYSLKYLYSFPETRMFVIKSCDVKCKVDETGMFVGSFVYSHAENLGK